jgi:hypothetical protein
MLYKSRVSMGILLLLILTSILTPLVSQANVPNLEKPQTESKNNLSENGSDVFLPSASTSLGAAVPNLDYVFANNVHMQIFMNNSFPQDCIISTCEMLSNFVLPQLSEKFWIPTVSSTIYVYNITSQTQGGGASAWPVSFNSQGRPSLINGSVSISNNYLVANQISNYASIWLHEFVHIFQNSIHYDSPIWALEPQAKFFERSLTYNQNKMQCEKGIQPDIQLSSLCPMDGVSFYLETLTNHALAYSGTEGWGRLYTWDNQIFKKINEQLANMSYFEFQRINSTATMNAEQAYRDIIIKTLNTTKIGNVEISQWLNSYGFCDLEKITVNTPYFRWALSYQNDRNTGIFVLHPIFARNQTNAINVFSLNFTVKLYDALSGNSLLNKTGTVLINQIYTYDFSPIQLGSPQAIIAKITATTPETIENQKTVFDTSGKYIVTTSSHLIFPTLSNSTMVKVAFSNNVTFQTVSESLSIKSINYTKIIPANTPILSISQLFLESDMPINLTLVETNLTFSNFILLRSIDDIIIPNLNITTSPTPTPIVTPMPTPETPSLPMLSVGLTIGFLVILTLTRKINKKT